MPLSFLTHCLLHTRKEFGRAGACRVQGRPVAAILGCLELLCTFGDRGTVRSSPRLQNRGQTHEAGMHRRSGFFSMSLVEAGMKYGRSGVVGV